MINVCRAGIPALFIVASLCIPGCDGQTGLQSFFDPDETNSHLPLVTNALEQFCPGRQLSLDAHGKVTGCKDCPLQTTEHDENGLDWELSRVFTGHFTSVSEDNILLSGVGCEAHNASFGGTAIFKVEGSTLRLLGYRSGLITEKCHKFRVPGHPDMLICVTEWGAQVDFWSYVYLVRFRQNGETYVQHIFETLDLSRQPCGTNFYDDSKTTVQKAEISSLSLGNLPENNPKLSVIAKLGKKDPSDEERTACQQRQKPIPLHLISYRLEFTFENGIFLPSSASEHFLKLFPAPESKDQPWLP